ncbi:MAG: hypothetical protein EPN75_09005 [Beijerinckiaceae bacterium]|nr:MAG: hypothetical protein EPN75_09005 [Beijerinckiaceae bacterium]
MIPISFRKPAGAAILALLVLALAGCGRRGALEPPPDSGLSTPSTGPVSPSLDAAATTGGATATSPKQEAREALGKPAKPKPPATKPMLKSFFLDPYVD